VEGNDTHGGHWRECEGDRARLGVSHGYFRGKPFPVQNTPTFSNPVILHTYPPMKMEQTECFETSAYKIQTPGNYPEGSIKHSENGESLKLRKYYPSIF